MFYPISSPSIFLNKITCFWLFVKSKTVRSFVVILLFIVFGFAYGYGDTVLDRDHDGFPDQAELLSNFDRSNFRLWFVYIALSQYFYPSPLWNKEERDCAGLIRFSYKEALKKHDNNWFKDMPFLVNLKIPDVTVFNYPYIPIIGIRLFRIAPGEFTPQDASRVKELFSPYADAYNLVKYNMVKLGRRREGIKEGDILVFYNPYDPRMPFHTMIFVGRDIFRDPNGPDDWLLYHTGPRTKDSGIIKKVELSLLRHHRDPRWRPIPENPFFLGYFRFKILDN